MAAKAWCMGVLAVTRIILLSMLSLPLFSATYYLAPAADGGNDSNSGSSPNAPWLSPNHSLKCGDTIIAAPSSSYNAADLTTDRWGNVSCADHGVAWLTCRVFDACKLISTNGIHPDASHWGISGWEVQINGGSGAGCFAASPRGSTIEDIIFANDVANGCGGSGVTTYNNGNQGVDYIVVIGNIVWNATQGNISCYSGINILQPVQSDTVAGTHIYVAGNFAFDNRNPSPCGGTQPTDGEGIIIDTLNGSGDGENYAQQVVVENNLAFLNGGRGISCCGDTSASIIIRRNTLFGNTRNVNGACGEILMGTTVNTIVTENLAETGPAGCSSNPNYVFYVQNADATSTVFGNFGYSAEGNNIGISNSPHFSDGPNTFGTNPNFAATADPGAPNCAGFPNVPVCMAGLIANFTPQSPVATGYGYRPAGPDTPDALFPQWLCNVDLPSGLVTMGCTARRNAKHAQPRPERPVD